MGSADFSIEQPPSLMVPVALLQLHYSALPWKQVGDEHHSDRRSDQCFSRERQIFDLKSRDGVRPD